MHRLSKNGHFDFLIDYISYLHHSYVRLAGPALQKLLLQFVEGHKRKYPHLIEVEIAYNHLLKEVLADIKEEEEHIFPYLKQMGSFYSDNEAYSPLLFEHLKKPLNNLVHNELRRPLVY